MGYGAVAVAAICLGQDVQSFKLAMLLLAFQAGNHLVNEVIDIEELQLHAGVVDGIRQVVGKGVAEGGHGTVVIGAAPLAKEIGESINQHLGTRLLAVIQEQVFTGFLAATVLGVAKAAGEAGLLAAGEHHRAGVVVLLERIEQGAGKAKVALHKLLLVLRAVHACQVEHKVGLAAPLIQLLGSGIQVVLKDSFHGHIAIATGLAVLDVIELSAKVLTHEPLCSCYQYSHVKMLNVKSLSSKPSCSQHPHSSG